MSVWVWPAAVFAGVLFAAAIRRGRAGLAAGFAAYAMISAWLAGATAAPLRFTAPLIALVAGYWLTGPFYTRPSPALEARLLRFDDRLRVEDLSAATPRALRALLELAYAGCYPFMVLAAVPAFRHSAEAFAWHWTLVLAAELACYVTLPWLQARPPREIGAGSQLFFQPREKIIETRPHFLRRLNEAVLRNLSVKAATIPSGHVAGPVAASLSVWMIAPQYGPWLLAGAGLIAVATVAGRYHYAADALLGVAVGVAPPAVRWFWL